MCYSHICGDVGVNQPNMLLVMEAEHMHHKWYTMNRLVVQLSKGTLTGSGKHVFVCLLLFFGVMGSYLALGEMA